MDGAAFEEMHEALVAKGYTGTVSDVRKLYVRGREATEWRLLRARWETSLPKKQVQFLDRLRALLEDHFEESYVTPFFYDSEKSTMSFSGPRKAQGFRFEAVSIQAEKGHVYAVAKFGGDWRRTKDWYFEDKRSR
jgi:hypothetical protein